MTNTVEEKSNRIIEVLLSSVSPSQLMHGKIYGIAFTGMTIIGTWVLFAVLASWLAPTLLGEGGGSLSFLIAAISNTGYLTSFVLYFLGGYLLYAAVLVAIGSVCNTLKEAQNLVAPVNMALFVPFMMATGETGEDLDLPLWPYMGFVSVCASVMVARVFSNPTGTGDPS